MVNGFRCENSSPITPSTWMHHEGFGSRIADETKNWFAVKFRMCGGSCVSTSLCFPCSWHASRRASILHSSTISYQQPLMSRTAKRGVVLLLACCGSREGKDGGV